MTDEELRKFCLEQAVLISINKKSLNEFGRISESISLFDLSNMIFQYIKSGAKPTVKISVIDSGINSVYFRLIQKSYMILS